MAATLKDFVEIIPLFWRPPFEREKIEAFQEQRLRHIIRHAYWNVPYYRELFDRAGVKPAEIRTVSDLVKIPLTSKEDIKRTPEMFLAREAKEKRLGRFLTTGSTGVPLIIRRTMFEDLLFHLYRMRIIRYYGLKCRDRTARVRGGNFKYVPRSWRFIQYLGFYRQIRLSTSNHPRELARILLKERPDAVTGYTGVLARVAVLISAEFGERLRPKFVLGSADMMTPLTRRQIAGAFDSPLYDNYVTQEVGLVAWECSKTGDYHVCDDGLVLEILKDGRPAAPGESGEVVATSLLCRAMPFIRYRLADMAVKGRRVCGCGQPFSTIRALQGKQQDYIYLPHGREVYPWQVTLLIQDYGDWIQQYQLIQERENRVVLRIASCLSVGDCERAILQTKVKELLGEDIEFEIQEVPEIEPGPGGKYWYQRSLVKTLYEQ